MLTHHLYTLSKPVIPGVVRFRPDPPAKVEITVKLQKNARIAIIRAFF